MHSTFVAVLFVQVSFGYLLFQTTYSSISHYFHAPHSAMMSTFVTDLLLMYS